MKVRIFIACVASLLIIAPVVSAEQRAGDPLSAAAAPASVSTLDRSFVQAVKLYAWHEIEIGRLAEQRASTDEIRSLGRMLANQSSKLSADLTDIAVTAGLKLRQEATVEHSRTWYELQKLHGAAFDQRFAAEVYRDQQDAVRIFNAEIDRGENAQLRQYAVNSISLLEQNLAAAGRVLKATGAAELPQTEGRERTHEEEGNPREPRPTNPAGGSITTHWQY